MFRVAEAQRSCGTPEYVNWRKQKDPQFGRLLDQAHDIIEHYLANKPVSQTRTVIKIPVVVHVVYKTAAQNISDEQVLSQIEVLNEDFRRLNSDTVNTPAAFKPVAADCEIEFCLAQRDPNGFPTNGINRVQTTQSSFGLDDKVKYASQGGADAWDVKRYFNIWVCNLSFGLLGYAVPPSANIDETFGIVVSYKYFGRTGNVDPPYDRGRTATHEIGHCFNLEHIWGDDGNSCTGTDYVADTPNQADETYGCPSYPQISCNNGPNGDMFMNFMDYTDDACMNLFTQGQKDRMLAAINNFLSFLTTSDACLPLADLDAGVIHIEGGTICSTSFDPVVMIKNYGLDTLNSLHIHYSINGNPPSVYLWNGVLLPTDTVTITLPTVSLNGGANTITVFTAQPNGGTDGYPDNDAFTQTIQVSLIGTTPPVFEEFASGVFPPQGWQVYNPDGGYTWQQSTLGYNSNNSAYVRNYDYSSNGEIDELLLPSVNLTTLTAPKLSFYVAYRLYTNPNNSVNYSDTLTVLVSTDCGASWQVVYKKWGTDLTTITPPYSQVEFKPSSPNHWRLETIDLAPFAFSENLLIKFRNTTDYENNLYIDKVNINVATAALPPMTDGVFAVFPNPAEGVVYVTIPAAAGPEAQVWLTDLTGRTLATTTLACGSVVPWFLPPLADGVYLLTARADAALFSSRLEVAARR
ncbi:MAG: M43 family zinc metalloprotease [Chitinophagales bacterium]|nr:M43 family zinc metalloprotease [Chitinophagales bacterium]MDW8427473.1 M43 family zinc metalloprotease [Chitinophagales bacterium]